MSDYAKNACELYEQLSDRKLSPARTQFVSEGSLLQTDLGFKRASIRHSKWNLNEMFVVRTLGSSRYPQTSF